MIESNQAFYINNRTYNQTRMCVSRFRIYLDIETNFIIRSSIVLCSTMFSIKHKVNEVSSNHVPGGWLYVPYPTTSSI